MCIYPGTVVLVPAQAPRVARLPGCCLAVCSGAGRVQRVGTRFRLRRFRIFAGATAGPDWPGRCCKHCHRQKKACAHCGVPLWVRAIRSSSSPTLTVRTLPARRSTIRSPSWAIGHGPIHAPCPLARVSQWSAIRRSGLMLRARLSSRSGCGSPHVVPVVGARIGAFVYRWPVVVPVGFHGVFVRGPWWLQSPADES